MSDKKLGQEPVFASSYNELIGHDSLENKEYQRVNEIGISKRLYIATKAMQGLLAGEYGVNMVNDGFPALVPICKQALQFADELLKQEDE